jgi:signal transduction histidine kinase
MDRPEQKVVIIDDSSFNRKLIITLLSEAGYEVMEAADAEAGIPLVKDSCPDLILLDVTMPGMDGYEACKRLKGDDKTRDVPVIFLTGRTEKEDIVKGFECGAVDYITIPFCREELLSRVRTHIDLSRSRQAIAGMKNDYLQLLQMICHDLLNPLSHVKFIFEAEDDNPGIFETMKEDVRDAVENSIDIIEVVRKMRSISGEENRLDLEAVNVGTAAENLSHMLQGKFREKEIDLVMDIEKEVHVIAETTSFLNSVLNNLLTNAIKFSHPGSRVELSARQVNGQVHLTVKDSGIGMSKRLIDDLFKMDAVTARKGTAGEKGTGYGMRLIKRFVDAYGGSIEVSSKEHAEGVTDHGTTVTVSLKKADPV